MSRTPLIFVPALPRHRRRSRDRALACLPRCASRLPVRRRPRARSAVAASARVAHRLRPRHRPPCRGSVALRTAPKISTRSSIDVDDVYGTVRVEVVPGPVMVQLTGRKEVLDRVTMRVENGVASHQGTFGHRRQLGYLPLARLRRPRTSRPARRAHSRAQGTPLDVDMVGQSGGRRYRSAGETRPRRDERHGRQRHARQRRNRGRRSQAAHRRALPVPSSSRSRAART